MPPNNEYTITAPLPESELRQLIHEVSFATELKKKNANSKFKFLPWQCRPMETMKVRQC